MECQRGRLSALSPKVRKLYSDVCQSLSSTTCIIGATNYVPKGYAQCIEPYGNLNSDAYQNLSTIHI